MKKLLEIIDAKLITSVGGIILAAGLTFVLYKILTNDLSHLDKAIRETSNIQSTIQQATNEVLRKNAEAISGNTEVLRSLQTIIIQQKR